MKDLLISIWIRTPTNVEESGEAAMSQKTMMIRLHCSLDNGKKQWRPGECAELPERQAQDLLDMGLAESVEAAATETEPENPEGGADNG